MDTLRGKLYCTLTSELLISINTRSQIKSNTRGSRFSLLVYMSKSRNGDL